MELSAIKAIYLDYIGSMDYAQAPELCEVIESNKKLETVLKNSLAAKLAGETIDLAFDFASAKEYQGFVHGFKYAFRLAKECYQN